MKVLVSGGAGFIGSHLVDRLIKEGHQVAVVDDLSTGFRDNVNPKATFYEVNICNRKEIARIFDLENPDYVDHHAAQIDIRKSVADPLFDANSNILGSLNLITSSLEKEVKKFIYASTGGAMYGEPEHLPVNEEYPVSPISQYGVSKHTAEHYLRLYNLLYGLKYTILRYANVYGPRQNPKGEAGVTAIFANQMLNKEKSTIFGDGNKTRDYIYIEDVVEANILALNKGDGQIYNIGTGRETSDQEMFDALKEVTGSKSEPVYGKERPGEVHHISLDPSKAKRDLSWEPRHSLKEGLKKSVGYYKSMVK
jgi:UDP-glucose 4-epimerase